MRRDWVRAGEGGGRGGAGRGEDSYIQNTDPHRTGQTYRQTERKTNQRHKQTDRWMDNVTLTTRGNIQTHHVTQPGGGDSIVKYLQQEQHTSDMDLHCEF